MKYIYTITCIYDIPPYCYENITKEKREELKKEFNSHGGISTMGFTFSLQKAKEIVINNKCDIHEQSFKYALVEQYEQGIYHIPKKEYWFEWINCNYVEIQKPEKLKHITAFGMS